MSTILVPVDFSPASESLIEYATGLAKARGASLLLLNVYPLPLASPEMPAEIVLADEIRNDAGRRMEALCASLKHSGIPIESRMVAGSPGSEIVYIAERLNPELIVMATHEAGKERTRWLGSNTLHVIDRVRSPLLVVPHNTSFEGWENIVCGTDYHYHELDAIRDSAHWLKAFNPKLTFVHVFDGGSDEERNTHSYRQSFIQKVQELTGMTNIEFVDDPERRDILEALNEHAIGRGADALLVLHKVRKGLARWLEHSLAHSYIHSLHVPLFSFPIRPAELEPEEG